MKTLTAVVLVLALTGCDKLKAAAGKDADGGAATSSGSGGGVLSFLASEFEGEITMHIKTARDDRPILVQIKKPRYRLDFVDPQKKGDGSMIVDVPARKTYVLIHPSKMAMAMSFDDIKNMKGKVAAMTGVRVPDTSNQPPPKSEKTGKKDSVAGYECEEWKITQSDGKVSDACMAEGIEWVDVGELSGLGGGPGLGVFATEANHFPLRVIGHDKAGAEELRFEATKVERKPIDPALLAVPAGYNVMDMSTMMQGLMGGALPSGLVPPPPPPKH